MEYYKVEIDGFVVYCDACIIKNVGSLKFCQFISLIGTPSTVKAVSALLYSGRSCFLSKGTTFFELLFTGSIQTLRTRKIEDSVVKILAVTSRRNDEGRQESLVFGESREILKHRAFLSFDAVTSIPLKPEWEDWLYEEVLDPLVLDSFGSKELTHACLIRWADDESLQQKILEGVAAGYLR